jgi:hypothetical protein
MNVGEYCPEEYIILHELASAKLVYAASPLITQHLEVRAKY